MEVELRVVQHAKSETADKNPSFKVVLLGITAEQNIVKLSIKSEDEDLFEEFSLKSGHVLKLLNPQTKLG